MAKVTEKRGKGERVLALGGVEGTGFYSQNPRNFLLSQEEVPVVQRSSVVFQLGEQVKIQPGGKWQRFISAPTPK